MWVFVVAIWWAEEAEPHAHLRHMSCLIPRVTRVSHIAHVLSQASIAVAAAVVCL